MIPHRYIELCRRLAHPVGALDSVLVPVSAGGRDSHGQSCLNEGELRERLIESLGDARVAIEEAQVWLANNPEGIEHGL